jgi:malonyl CoA-acyl carrier protein transacylase
MEAFVFAGQGSQRQGMGGNLFETVPEFARAEREIDALLGYSVRELCLQDGGRRLQQTAYTQPALFVVNALHAWDALSRGLQPRYLAGHSLGEYNALLAAGVFDFVTGVRLVQKRGALMGEARDGGMAAIVGLESRRIEALLREHGLDAVDVANHNSRTQTVLSGPVDELRRAGPVFEAAGAHAVVPLPVSAAFHSRYMKRAAAEFATFLADVPLRRPSIPVLSNVTARPYPRDGDAGAMRELLVRQIAEPVLWTQCVLYLLDRGIETFHEMGPGNVLTRLVNQIRQPPVPADAAGDTPMTALAFPRKAA